jgi:hypothetical protein
MFDEGERTDIKGIPPAKNRITEYKRKSFGRLFTEKLSDRPISGVASSTGIAD